MSPWRAPVEALTVAVLQRVITVSMLWSAGTACIADDIEALSKRQACVEPNKPRTGQRPKKETTAQQRNFMITQSMMRWEEVAVGEDANRDCELWIDCVFWLSIHEVQVSLLLPGQTSRTNH